MRAVRNDKSALKRNMTVGSASRCQKSVCCAPLAPESTPARSYDRFGQETISRIILPGSCHLIID